MTYRSTKAPTLEREEFAFPLFPTPGSTCPRCRSTHLFEDAEPGLPSCFRCSTWLREGREGGLIPTAVEVIDTAALPLPWRKAKV